MAHARAAPRIHFVLDPRATRWADIDALGENDIARAPGRFVGGRNSWIAQSFVRLRAHIEARGWRASAGPGFPPGAICIAHRDDVDRFASGAYRGFLVVVRADRAPARACDLAIVQNGLAPGRRERFVPLWPQPGLLARDERRGARIESLAYHGRAGSSPRWFADPAFHAALRRRGIAFEARYRGWEDYRQVDLALAARDDVWETLKGKPATKLYNAWAAGVPTLASPEPAYEELRRGRLDYLRISGAVDVIAAVDILRADPRLYESMVRNGRERALDFSVAAVRDRWMAFLDDAVMPAYRGTSLAGAPRRFWFLGAMAAQKASSRAHRMRRVLQLWTQRAKASAALLGARGESGATHALAPEADATSKGAPG